MKSNQQNNDTSQITILI